MNISRFTLIAHAIALLASGELRAQNDDCAGAIVVVDGANGPFNNVDASTSFVWPCGAGGNDVWFLYVAPGAGSLTVDTCAGATDFDTVLQVFDGSGGCDALVSLGCNDDSCGTRSSVTTNVSPGTSYYIRVGGFGGDGFGGEMGRFTLSVHGPNATGTVATATAVGAGCLAARFASFYEHLSPAGTFDLANTSLTMLSTAPGYVGLALGSYVAPSSAATNLALTDDSEVTRTLTTPFPYDGGVATSLTICSNGFVSVAPGNGLSFEPEVRAMLTAPQTAWWCWNDYDPSIAGSGSIKFEEVGPVAYVTWDGVWNFSGTSAAAANTFQFQFDSSNGSVTFAWQTMSSVAFTGFLVGYSPGGASVNPGPVDISVALVAGGAIVTPVATDQLSLSVAASNRPVLGTTWSLVTGNIPATGVVGIEILGLSNPDIKDLSSLGMPGCGLFASLDLLTLFPVTGASHDWSLAIPSDAALISTHIHASSAVFLVPAVNAFGAISSNGMDGSLGDL